jgi:cytoskeletal protein RodZ
MAAALPPLGETFRTRRLERGLSIEDAAAEVGIPAKILRALEWDRPDLLTGAEEVPRLEREYAAYLGLDDATEEYTGDTPPPLPEVSRAAPTGLLSGVMRYRQALALAAIGIAVAVAVFIVLNALA